MKHEPDVREDLQALDLNGLRQQWRNLSGKTAPVGVSRSLLVRMIAYQRQAARLGGLTSATERMLARIAVEARTGSEASASAQVAKATGSDRKLAPGTILVREWQGVLQRVTVLNEGFAWNGTTYPSLSRVAREITGVRWNGHVFFGDRARKDKAAISERHRDPTPAPASALTSSPP